MLKISEKGIETKKIYSLSDFRKTIPKDFSEQRLEEAFRQAEDSYLRPVFIFKDDGSLEEASRPQSPATFDNTNKIN